ncbi:MAG: hypothetical protein GY861_14140 [bacterium]|nr:hypothetical protein [bacterium]
MKKLYTTSEYKTRQKRIIEKCENRRQKRKEQKKKYYKALIHTQKPRFNPEFEKRNVSYNRKQKSQEIVAPRNLSIIENAEDTLEFFHSINEHLRKRHRVFLDISSIQKLTIDAILYLLSLFKYNDWNLNEYEIRGNLPEDDTCREIFVQSGLLDHVTIRGKAPKKDEDKFVSIQSGNENEPTIAAKVIDFARKKLDITTTNFRSRTYEVIIEIMANANEHAYGKSFLKHKWWLMAYHDFTTDVVHYAFLDNGLGIPATVRKNFKERLLSAGIMDFSQDSDLIQTALEGIVQRTRTKESHRGNGLPKVFKIAQEGLIDNLIVVSNKGYYNCTKNFTQTLDRKFHGSLLTWDFK